MEIVRRWNIGRASTLNKIVFAVVVALALASAAVGFAANAWGHWDAGLAAQGQRVERYGDDAGQLPGIARRRHHVDGALI